MTAVSSRLSFVSPTGHQGGVFKKQESNTAKTTTAHLRTRSKEDGIATDLPGEAFVDGSQGHRSI